MPETKCYSPVRGRVIRVTKLDACGNPVPGTSAVVVSKRISSIRFEEITEDGTNIRDRNFGDEIITVDEGFTDTLGFSAEVVLAGVDPALITHMTGQPVVKNAAGDIVGFDIETGIDLDGFGWSLEVWSKIAGNACASNGSRQWGYTLLPFLKGGRLGGFSIENAAVQFTVTGAKSQEGNGWGVGPFNVDRNVAGVPSPMFEPLSENAVIRTILVSNDPPAANCGSLSLASV